MFTMNTNATTLIRQAMATPICDWKRVGQLLINHKGGRPPDEEDREEK
jgi:hypothetical protein